MAAEYRPATTERNSELLTSFVIYPHTVVVKDLAGYSNASGRPIPIWGSDRLALYHPIRSELTHLGDEAWSVFDTLAQETKNPQEIAFATGLDYDRVKDVITEFQSRWIALPEGQTMNVAVEPNFNEEAEMYLETTEACNFRCPDCATGVDRYLAGQARTMDGDTLQMLLKHSVRGVQEKDIRRLRIKWAGGEALMPISLRLIREGQRFIQSLQERYPSVEISQVILTNGSHLNENVVAELKEWGIHISVSLWGIGEINDVARGVKRPQDKYPNIIKGVERLHDAGVSFNFNHVVTPGNAAQFGDFLRAAWDTESDTFIGKDWAWTDSLRKSIPVGITFFRPQVRQQLEALNAHGYRKMVDGLRGGFAVMRELIERGIPIQSLDKIDYLQLFGVIPTPCGSGFNYLAAGPRGVASCHEALFSMPENLELVRNGVVNMVDLANSEYRGQRHNLIGANIEFPNVDQTTRLILALHGGAGCPRTMRAEHDGKLGEAASIAESLYAPIMQELLSLETMRRLRNAGKEAVWRLIPTEADRAQVEA